MNPQLTFRSLLTDRVLQQTHSTTSGLSGQDAKYSLSESGGNSLKSREAASVFGEKETFDLRVEKLIFKQKLQ